MADKEEVGDNTTPRATDWEVVSLTASAYAASPGGPNPVQSKSADDHHKDVHPLYMSRHFVFPPSHDNMATEPSEDKGIKKMDSEFSLEQETRGKEDGEDLTLKGLDLAKDDDDEFPGLEFSEEEEDEEKCKIDENNIYKTSLENERAFGGSHVYEPVHQQTDPDVSHELDPTKDDDKQHHVEPWWKRSAASFISQAKETNTVWSIFIAAAVMGVVVLGQRWQHERWQFLQLKWESSIGNEKAGRLMGPMSRLKQAFVGGQRRDSFIRVSSQNDS